MMSIVWRDKVIGSAEGGTPVCIGNFLHPYTTKRWAWCSEDEIVRVLALECIPGHHMM